MKLVPRCFYCDRTLTWNTAYLTVFGKTTCRECKQAADA